MKLVQRVTESAVCLAVFCVATAPTAAAPTVSLKSLLQEMVDRESLARFPRPAYTCRQSSSYDRDSSNPADKATWFANWDRSQFIRIEETDGRNEYVMMDAEGPGAVVRIWSTWHGPGGGEFSNGTLRVYLDGAATPAIEGPVADIIDGGALAGPPLSQGVSTDTPYRQRGHNLYLPIPYARGCKITYSTDVLMDQGARKGEALYYQINYRTYEPGTEVETFSMERLAAARPTLNDVQRKLREGRRDPGSDEEQAAWSGQLAQNQSQTVAEFEGPGAIRQLRFKLEADDLSQALRSTVLRCTFDGEQAVWVPLGDFFAAGATPSPYRTWYTEVAEGGELSCCWVMPFENSAVVSLQNLGSNPVAVEVAEAHVSGWQWDDRSMHFHATWRQLSNTGTGGEPDKPRGNDGRHARDVNYVTVDGKGVYAGDTLTIFNGAAAWWGEGDEKIYVDGEGFPSHIGTGTEDYYGYAWGRPTFFDAPFHAQPHGGGNSARGLTVNSRYRALDAIPFNRDIRVDMELWHWVYTNVDFAPTAFFYARPGATANVAPAPEEAARPRTR